jgi:ABC-type Zn uptake system ZnuABC Zn-binding protein ZnuA
MWRTHRGASSILLLLFLSVLGCRGAEEATPADDLPVVVTSIFPIGDLARQLAGGLARVEVLLPQGASPATFDVTPRQLRDLQRARLYIMIGGGLDEWVSRLPGASGGDSPVVRLSDGVHLLAGKDDGHGHDAASGNPHIWLDPILVRDEILPKMEEGLRQAFPEGAELIGAQAILVADSLTALDAEIREALRPLERRSFVATHSAWVYFAARYGLEEAGVVHAHVGQDPSSREMADLLSLARDRGITCIFTEPQLGEIAVSALATELSLPTCELDPLGGPDQEDRAGYLRLLRFNTRQLVLGLGGSGS